jgi:hypothetical protein
MLEGNTGSRIKGERLTEPRSSKAHSRAPIILKTPVRFRSVRSDKHPARYFSVESVEGVGSRFRLSGFAYG